MNLYHFSQNEMRKETKKYELTAVPQDVPQHAKIEFERSVSLLPGFIFHCSLPQAESKEFY